MSILRIEGGRALDGALTIHGAKNSVLPIMAAAIVANGESVIHNCPALSDVEVSIKILKHLGCRVKREGTSVWIDSSTMDRCDIPDGLMREMRSSVVFMGAILARAGEAELSMPGGCELGPRPIDLHLYALRTLGTHIKEHGGKILCAAEKLQGNKIHFPIPSVGATENAMLAACACEGTTLIINAAREPEICDLQDYLNKTGVDICGAGTAIIRVEGRPKEKGIEHRIIPDRIVAASYIAALGAAGGKIALRGVEPCHIDTVVNVMREMGCTIDLHGKELLVARQGDLSAVRPVCTGPYPDFPTDAQPPVMAASLLAKGTTVFVENIFENRYRHVPELLRMGADVRIKDRVAVVCGVQRLHGAAVESTDLRGGAALIIAALAAEGTSDITGLSHVDRGYEHIETALSKLGADARRI